ncbi:MAG TPA: DUF2520 domain-containing protein [Bacteroidales bacterium]|nr:DUF2520 domain-containing protein [Bacteroidales bacterium]HPS18149.1 DUF2520 domain-containing protein [Bacteroidales bacterium]
MHKLSKIVFIGAGNVASQLAVNFVQKKIKIVQVYSRTKISSSILASKINADSVNKISDIIPDADLYIISVSDNALPGIVKQLHVKDKLVVHTSGFHDMKVLKGTSDRIGVLYPLQTFSKNKKVDLKQVPFCIEALNKDDEILLINIAKKLSSNVRVMNSEKRRMIHLAAVFVCNFTNYMYISAEKILKNKKISFDILKPLILETASKVLSYKPSEMQTGPAVRGDKQVMEKHMEMLDDKNLRELYKIISNMIYTRSYQVCKSKTV